MRKVAIGCLAILLVFGFGLGCGSEDEQPAAGGGMKVPDTKKVIDDAKDAADEELTFACAQDGCEKTKTGTVGDPPS